MKYKIYREQLVEERHESTGGENIKNFFIAGASVNL